MTLHLSMPNFVTWASVRPLLALEPGQNHRFSAQNRHSEKEENICNIAYINIVKDREENKVKSLTGKN